MSDTVAAYEDDEPEEGETVDGEGEEVEEEEGSYADEAWSDDLELGSESDARDLPL